MDMSSAGQLAEPQDHAVTDFIYECRCSFSDSFEAIV